MTPDSPPPRGGNRSNSENPPATPSGAASSPLWESFRVDGSASLVREAIELACQELIEAESAEAVGVARDERSEARRRYATGTVRFFRPSRPEALS